MITVSQKCQYALRGVFELGKRPLGESAMIAEIAAAQAIPQRFLEVIFAELRQARLIKSYRGPQGGHALARTPSEITVGEIVRLVEGPTTLVRCVSGDADCPFSGACPFKEMWEKAAEAMQ